MFKKSCCRQHYRMDRAIISRFSCTHEIAIMITSWKLRFLSKETENHCRHEWDTWLHKDSHKDAHEYSKKTYVSNKDLLWVLLGNPVDISEMLVDNGWTCPRITWKHMSSIEQWSIPGKNNCFLNPATFQKESTNLQRDSHKASHKDSTWIPQHFVVVETSI